MSRENIENVEKNIVNSVTWMEALAIKLPWAYISNKIKMESDFNQKLRSKFVIGKRNFVIKLIKTMAKISKSS